MNTILFFIIVFLILLFSFYYLVNCESFENQNRIIDFYNFDKMPLNKYDQIFNFIPDKRNYRFEKDSGFLRDPDNNIILHKSEYYNLEQKLLKKKQQKQSNNDKDTEAKEVILDTIKLDKVNYPLIRKELNMLQMDQILVTIENRYNFEKFDRVAKNVLNLSEEPAQKYNYSYKLVKNWFIEQVSKEADKPIYSIEYVNNTRYKIVNDKILYYKIDYVNNVEEYGIQFRMFRDDKINHFVIYLEIVIDSYLIDYYIKNIVLLGVDFDENIIFNKYKNNKYKNLTDTMKDTISDGYLKNYKKNVADFLKKSKKKTLSEREGGYCFYKDAKNKLDCISPVDGQVSIWDTPCKFDEDCPFFKKNTNYPNKRGGCYNGYCEMPVNVQRFGYKEFEDPPLNAICYNCKKNDFCEGISCNMCCEDQKDKNLYPNLNSPDYAFTNDFDERLENSNKFDEKNLSTIKLIA